MNAIELQFSAKDVIYIVCIMVPLILEFSYFKFKMTRLEEDLKRDRELTKENFVHAKNGRKGILAEVTYKLEKQENLFDRQIESIIEDNRELEHKISKKLDALDMEFKTVKAYMSDMKSELLQTIMNHK